ncbi:type IVB secretion system protein IcmH/DotU [Piscirickettsia litoralis]|uniref:type IVB secretion system protein IcmH/DotU n=1 Tax=Piscirickettsia litoralis TaxID=1891921 RepID=UPI0013018B05|nr:type IVB secretion system protein IcmH/DotU [Piscirickettsia litoralis]
MIKNFDANTLRHRVISCLNDYIDQCGKLSISQEKTKASTYILCCLIDETILLHSWSKKIEWDKAGALHFFFNESWGGEKFYQICQHCLDKIDTFHDVLDLIQTAINFGFKGRYGAQTDGEIQLAKLSHNLKEKLSKYHPKPPTQEKKINEKKVKKSKIN